MFVIFGYVKVFVKLVVISIIKNKFIKMVVVKWVREDDLIIDEVSVLVFF